MKNARVMAKSVQNTSRNMRAKKLQTKPERNQTMTMICLQ